MPSATKRLASGGLVACALFALSGCEGRADARAERVQLTREADVATVTVTDLWSSDWPNLPGVRIDTLVAPSEGDEPSLVAPLHASFLGGGELLVGDAGARRIWIRAADGAWREGPGPGEGPGELQSVGGVWSDGEGFIVHDPVAGDLVHFDRLGAFVERHPVGTRSARHGAGTRAMFPWTPTVQRIGADTWFASVADVPRPSTPESTIEPQFTFTVVSGNPAREELAVGSGHGRIMQVQGGGGAPIPFAPTAFGAGAASRVAISTGESAEVRILDESGSLLRVLRWTDVPRPLDASHRGALRDFLGRIAPSSVPPAVLESRIASMEESLRLPETLPHLGDLKVAADGAIWLGWPERSGLELPDSPELVKEWRVIAWGSDPEEARVYRVTLPDGATLLGPVAPDDAVAPDAAGGAFFLLLRDDLGRQGIGVLRLLVPS